ncbi:MAG: hypothetical protein DBX55_04055 [Verrucomicrobia bacterium]|nr:MAG: hypothetical protein DBX55_04055 [Verrucomicrobiota bacterium]
MHFLRAARFRALHFSRWRFRAWRKSFSHVFSRCADFGLLPASAARNAPYAILAAYWRRTNVECPVARTHLCADEPFPY